MLIKEGIKTTYHNTISEQKEARHETRQYARNKHIKRYHDIVQRNTNKHTPLFFIAIYAHRLSLRNILKGHIHIAIAKYQAWEGLVS